MIWKLQCFWVLELNYTLDIITYLNIYMLLQALLGDMPIKFIGKNFVHFSIGIKY